MIDATRAHRWPVRVYYEDTDFSGVVYHAGYLRFLERGRTELLRAAGISQGDLFADGDSGTAGAFAVRSMSLDFRAPARMDDILTVVSTLEAVGGASVTMRQQVEREGAILVSAVVRIGYVVGVRARRLPAELGRRLAQAYAQTSSS